MTSSFTFEFGGILVFDSQAALSTTSEPSEVLLDQPAEPWRLYDSLNTEDRKDVDAALDYDRENFKALPKYSPSPSYTPTYTLQIPPDQNLKFDSSFESGNLHKAIRVSETEYNLVLRYDT
jgi:hypothetical protein